MKAYKYQRKIHWSIGLTETVVFIPKFNVILFESQSGNKKNFGMSRKQMLLDEAKKYIEGVKTGAIKETVKGKLLIDTGNYIPGMYSSPVYSGAYGKVDKYVMFIPQERIGTTVYSSCELSGLHEIDIEDIDFSAVNVQELDKLNESNESKIRCDEVVRKIIIGDENNSRSCT